MFLPNRLTASVAAVAVVAGLSVPALAASPQQIADALTALVKAGGEGGTIALGAPTEQDGNIVFKNVVLTSPKADETKIGELTLANADLAADGSVTAELVTASTVTGGAEGNTFTIDSVELANPVFAAEGKKSKLDSMSVDNVAINQPGKPPVTIASAGLDLADYANDVPHSIDLSVEGLVIEPEAMGPEGAGMADQLKAVGYDKLELNFYGAGSLDQENGELSIDEITIDGTDMGTLTLSGVFGGFTDEVVKALATPNPSPDVASKVTLKEAGVYYGDASLTGRVIAYQAKQMGQEPGAFVDQITGALPLMLSVIGNQPFQDKLSEGLTTFLKDPKNIAVSVSPENPISLMDLFKTAESEPQKLPDMLSADVAANQDEDGGMDDDTQQNDDGSTGKPANGDSGN